MPPCTVLPPMVNGAERWYGTVTGGGQTGSVRVPRRCGYSLGLNRQFHVLVAVGGSLAGERLLAQDWLGVGLVSAGIFGLASRGAVRPAAVGWALGTGVAIGTYTTIDGLGARAAGDPLLYVAWLHLLFGPWIALAVGLRRGRSALPWLRRHGARSALGGVVATVGYGLAVWAFSRAGLAHMAALREVSVLFAAVIGAVWLGEGWGWRRLAAAATIVLGLLLLNG